MAEIKSFQEGWNNKHKDYLETKEKALEAGDKMVSVSKRIELKKANMKNGVNEKDIEEMLYYMALAWDEKEKALALNPYKASEKI